MIGGKVLDPSALAALVRGNLAAGTWMSVARWTGIVLLVPDLALHEAQAVAPWAREQLAELLDHPCVVLTPMTAAAAAQVAQRLDDRGVFDVTAGHVTLLAAERGWPVLTTDPERLIRVDPSVETGLL